MKKFYLIVSALIATCTVSKAQTFDAGYQHSIMVCADSSVYFWGYFTGQNTPVPTKVNGLSGIKSVCLGSFKWLALKSDGTVWQINYDNTTEQVLGLTNIVTLAAGDQHALALKNDGTVWAWGDNGKGQLGDGTTIDKDTPFQISGLSGITSIAGGTTHSLALKNDGTVWAWGSNGKGQLGNGTNTDSSTPVQVSGLTNVVAVDAGLAGNGNYNFSIALKNDGTVWCWGNNGSGQLGDGTSTARNTPVQATGVSGAVAITAGNDYTIALMADGSIWGWGQKGGIEGAGFGMVANTPYKSALVKDVVSIKAGALHTLAQKKDGLMFGWGQNSQGETGNGSTSTFAPIDTVNSSCIPSTPKDTTGEPTSIFTNSKNSLLVGVYPNPNSGRFVITLPENTLADVHLTNILGAIVYQQIFTSINNTIELNTLTEGIYILSATINGKNQIQKIIIQK